MSLTNTKGWTLSGLDKQSKYWKMIKDSYAESPSLDASQITSITINMRTWGGTQYNTIEFSVAGQKIGELKADNNNLKDYTWKPTTTPSGVGAMRFSSPTSTSNEGPAFSSITIETTGGGTGTTTTYTYSRYITSCQGTSDIESVELPTQVCNKIISNGQLLIEYNGVYYNTLGQQIQ
jgi:hypothetical protein